jgi:hypothetical protein
MDQDMRDRRILIAALVFEIFMMGLAPAQSEPSIGPVSIDMTIEPMLYFSAPVSSLTLNPPTVGTTWTGTLSDCEFGSNNAGGFDLIATDSVQDGYLKNAISGALINKLDMRCVDLLWKSIPTSPYTVSLHSFDQGEYDSQNIYFQQKVEYTDKPGVYEGTITFGISDTNDA